MPANVNMLVVEEDPVKCGLASGSIALLKPYTSEMLQRVLGEALATGSG